MLSRPKMARPTGPVAMILRTIGSADPDPVTLADVGHGNGYLQIPHFSLDSYITEPFEAWPELPISCYGVVSSPDTFDRLAPLEIVEGRERVFCVSFTEVRREDQPPEEGWRWSKWGPVLGEDLCPAAKYLYDEPLISTVWCYHVYELLRDRSARGWFS